jgi:hypothetical protein
MNRAMDGHEAHPSRAAFASRIALACSTLLLSQVAAAAEDTSTILKEIGDTASAICGYVGQSGSKSDVEIKGEIKAQLSELVKRLADAGIQGTATIVDSKYQGVIQEQLASVIKDNQECREKVFETLQRKLLPEPGQRPPGDAAKEAITAIASLIEEGNGIADEFVKTNDVGRVNARYEQWSAKADQVLRQKLDASYAAQLSSSPPYSLVKSGMATAGIGYWQHLVGKINVLNEFITELRRGGN